MADFLLTIIERYLVWVFVVFNLVTSLYEIKLLRKIFVQSLPKIKNTKKKKLSTEIPITRDAEALNQLSKAEVKNDVSDFQKIKTSPVVLPVIAATVLEYGPGELGKSYPGITKLYYSPEALKDKEFLESVTRSPWQVETHEKNTGEFNRSVDGWANEAWYDEKDKTVYAKGFLIGEENIQYTKENVSTPGFGTSAFISFLKVDPEKGKTPEGLEYDAIARKAVCNHVAILPNIRDPENKIVSINAKNAFIESKNLQGVKNMALDPKDFKEAMQAYEEEQNSESKLVNTIANKVMNMIEEKQKNSKNEEGKPEEKKPEPAANEEGKPEEKKPEPAANEEGKPEEKKEEPAKNEDKVDAENSVTVSEKLIGIFSDYYGVQFRKTPTVKQLCEISEIPYTKISSALNALKKKSEEIIASTVSEKNGSGSEAGSMSIGDALKKF